MEVTLDVTRRERFGRNETGRLRRAHRIPAVLYGGTQGVEALSVDPKALSRILYSQAGVNTLIGLRVDGATGIRVLVKAYQLDPVSHRLLHADFYRVAMDKILRVTVPVHLVGEAKGVKAEGGVVDFVHREVVIECLPADIPEHIAVDISELMLHDGVRVKDLVISGKWTPVSDSDMLIVHVIAPKVEEVAAPAETAAAAATPAAPAEPEVIKKGKIEKPGEEKEKEEKE